MACQEKFGYRLPSELIASRTKKAKVKGHQVKS